MQTVLVTGGAGYVGSHTCLRLAEAGFQPVVFDNLTNGHAEFVKWGPLETGDIRDAARLDAVFAQHKPVAVLHFAALIEVGESVRDPGPFYDNNVGGALSLIAAARRAGVNALVFSSTCATYGEPLRVPLDETHPQVPLNPYGRTKLMVEQALGDLDRYVGFRSICLRYFNAAGADPEGRIGERHDPETHAIPLAIRAAMNAGGAFRLMGEDYPTPDGTAVRDYIHVLDLADAHVAALKHLLGGGRSDVFNLGTGAGTSVRQLIEAIRRASNGAFDVERAPRREGDSPILVADNAKARSVLGWSPRYNLDAIIETAWNWHRAEAARALEPAV
jgi:UDP-glucose 4-epimerase